MDAEIVRFLNSGVGAFAPFDLLMEALVSDYLAPVAGSLAMLALWFSGNAETRPLNQIATAAAAAGIGFANIVTTMLGDAVDRARPFAALDLDLLFYEPTDPSFPSNAAAVGFALATPIFLRHRAAGAALYALAFGWGFARVYAGVHYPSDVLAGAAIGVASGLVAVGLFRLFAPLAHLALRGLRLLYAA